MVNSREKEAEVGAAPAGQAGTAERLTGRTRAAADGAPMAESGSAVRRTTGRPRGRPRSFDRETALEKAVLAFWEHGYEGTSVSDLTRVMGIGTPSLYAAFGDKRSLFEEVVGVYGDRYRPFGDRALAEEPTVRAAFERMLREAAVMYTAPGRPRGCLVVHAATNCTNTEVAESLRARRNAGIAAFENRIRSGMAAGELPAGTDAGALARYAGAVVQGMSQQARDGASREELEALVDIALATWPHA